MNPLCFANLECCLSTFVPEMYRAGMASNAMGGSSDREFGRSDLGVNRGFGDSFGGMGKRKKNLT